MRSSDNDIRCLIGAYQPTMIAQHARQATARKLAWDLTMATLVGAKAGPIVGWLRKLRASWFRFVLMLALFSSILAARIFAGDQAATMWQPAV